MGNSWGGGWALYFAERYLERVEKLILIDSSGIAFHDVFEWEAFKVPVIGEALSKFINYDSVKYSLRKVFFNQEKVDDIMIKEIQTPLLFENNLKSQYLAERNLNWKITKKDIEKIKSPTLIIWGKEDKYLSYKYAYEFQNKIHGSELLLIENCGHVAHEDCPEVVNKAILRFLGK